MIIPASHPLDFDWRFEDATVEALLPLFSGHNVLALGAPSVARRLDEQDIPVTLVDRQPLQLVAKHFVQEVEDFVAAERFTAAIMDPPWYPDDLIRWTVIAARALAPSGVIYASVWPSTARPSAADDLERAIKSIARWATIIRHTVPIAYRLPQFERVATENSVTKEFAKSPRKGLLLEVRPIMPPPKIAARDACHLWHRFVVDDYQLALRMTGAEGGAPRLDRHPEANGWLWPYVSARAPGRGGINLWSSAGEVAIVRSPQAVRQILARAFASSAATGFEHHLRDLPELLEWSIPRPPYREIREWHHPQ